MKKCKECGAALEGFMYKVIGTLFGLKESEKYKGICNKCEEKIAKKKKPAKKPAKAKKAKQIKK